MGFSVLLSLQFSDNCLVILSIQNIVFSVVMNYSGAYISNISKAYMTVDNWVSALKWYTHSYGIG